MFTAKNYKIFGLGIALLIIGFVLLGQGPVENPLSKSVAPVVLVFTYLVIFPWALLARDKNKEEVKKVS